MISLADELINEVTSVWMNSHGSTGKWAFLKSCCCCFYKDIYTCTLKGEFAMLFPPLFHLFKNNWWETMMIDWCQWEKIMWEIPWISLFFRIIKT